MEQDNSKHKIIVNGYPVIDTVDGKRFVHFNFYSTMGCVCGITDEAMENINNSIVNAELGGKIGQAHARHNKCQWPLYKALVNSVDYQIMIKSLSNQPFNDMVEVNSPFFEVKEGTTVAEIYEIMQKYYTLLDPDFRKYSVPVEIESTDIITGIVEKRLVKPIKPQYKGAFMEFLHRKEFIKYEQELTEYNAQWKNLINETSNEVNEAFNDPIKTPHYIVTEEQAKAHINAIEQSYIVAYHKQLESTL